MLRFGVEPADKQSFFFIYVTSKLLLGIVNTTMASFGPEKTSERLSLLMGDFQLESRLWDTKKKQKTLRQHVLQCYIIPIFFKKITF